MARLILDTGVLIGVFRRRLDTASALGVDDVVVPAIVAAEYLEGILLREGHAPASAQRRFLDEVLAVAPVVDYTLAVAREHAALLAHTRTAGRPRGAHALIVAATARAAGRVLLTTDRRARFDDLPGVEVRVVASREQE